ncbi:MAG: efflux RND transporter periplasmic adaptor subunit [Verrucomicrobiota bacterium]|jgi:hypothetical protein
MKTLPFASFAVALSLAVLLAGCGKHDAGDGHQHDGEKAEGKGDEHGHEESPSGASFKPGKGVIVTDETRKILGIETAEVTEQKLPAQLRFNLQVFGEVHHHDLRLEDHAGCDVHGSGFLSPDKAASVRAGLPVEIQSRSNGVFRGVVLDVHKELALGESEVVVGVSNANVQLKPGEFLSASVALPSHDAVAVIPRSALLQTSEGTFVYAVNGDAYFRTAVKIGGEADGLLEITDGLLAGDAVVTKPVETLYLIELRATKGGGHSH